MESKARWLWHEILKMLPVFIFFFVAFSLVEMTDIRMRREKVYEEYSFSLVVISSLIMAKVVVLSDRLPFIDQFSKKPLVYSTIWKTLIYVLASIIIRFLDRVVHVLYSGRTLEEGYEGASHEVVRLPFWLEQTWLFVLFLIFVAYKELIFAVGYEKVRKLFFG